MAEKRLHSKIFKWSWEVGQGWTKVPGSLSLVAALYWNLWLRTVPTNSKVFLPRFMIMQEM